MTKCYFCGQSCSGKTEIYDKKFLLTTESMGLKVCKLCFDKWSSGDETYLLQKLREKHFQPKLEGGE